MSGDRADNVLIHTQTVVPHLVRAKAPTDILVNPRVCSPSHVTCVCFSPQVCDASTLATVLSAVVHDVGHKGLNNGE